MNGDGTSVSVVMPLKNGRSYVEQAVRSVLDQSVQPQEIIVVDDGSTDGGAELVESMAATVPIKVVRQPSRGQSAARNVGVGLASGELIALLDQDDEWRREHLESLIKAISKEPAAGWAYSDFDEMDGEGRTVTHSFMREHRLVHPKTSLASCIAGDLMVLPSASLLRRRALLEVGGFDERLSGYEDDDLFVRMFRADWRHVFVPKPLTKFRVSANGESSSSTLRFLDSRMTYLEKLIESIADDDRLNRYWVRDLVLPRFFVTTVDDYARELSRARWTEAARAAEVAAQLASMMQPRLRRRIELALMTRPTLCRPALRALDRMPRRVQRLVNPALRLRVPSRYGT